ncbi:MAG: type I restriction-modification system subunit M [Galactobacter sp.]
MITGQLKSQVQAVWNAFWSGGIANPVEVIEQITYLLFLRRLDEEQTRKERQAKRLGTGVHDPVFRAGTDRFGRRWEDLRWSRFKDFAPDELFATFDESIFPFLKDELPRAAKGEASSYAALLQDARFTIPTPNLLVKAVDLIDKLDLSDRDTSGDLYELLLSELATSGTNGQFRTPRHIIETMVAMIDPKPMEAICDPAGGTCGFLMEAGEYLREQYPEVMTDSGKRAFFNNGQFHAYDSDRTMMRIGAMNLMVHGIENPAMERRDSLAQSYAQDRDAYDIILANPPFAGSLDKETVSKDLLTVTDTRKTELLFLSLFLKLLRVGGRAAVIVPDGVLFGSSKAHRAIRRALVEEQQLQAVVSLPSGVFKPYAGVSTAILFFTKTNSGGTDDVWFFDVKADGFSLDDKRTKVETNDLPQVLSRWQALTGDDAEAAAAERARSRTESSFVVPKSEIEQNEYDLSLNRYKEIVYEEVEHRDPLDIIAELEGIEAEIAQGLAELKELLK